MKANETNFLSFLDGTKQLLIPIYQRTYSWTKKQCEKLYDDIIRTGSDDRIAGHFIGSIVYIQKGLYQISTVPELSVIDGQQRLTTLSLLLKAISNKLIEDKNEQESKKILERYLLNSNETDEKIYKLVLTQSDKETLFSILSDRLLPERYSKKIKEIYDLFVNKIKNDNINIIYRGISKLFIIDVALDRERDKPQLIFESLNATGLALSQADLIRNYVLMELQPLQQNEIYGDYWFRIEQNFGHAEYSSYFDRFMRDYLTIKTGAIPRIDEVYLEFKEYSRQFVESYLNQNQTGNEQLDNQKYLAIKSLVADIYKYSNYFVSIALDKEKDKELRSIFTDIKDLKVEVSYPFILCVYDDYENNIIDKDIFIKILKIIESYVFRRAICGIPTNSLNKTFATLYEEIDKQNYLESFYASLLLKESYRRFPDNIEFSNMLIYKDVYNFRNRILLLNKLENYERKEPVNIEDYTIEHIMPQNENLSKEWQYELGENWQEIQKKYLHTIGNITLTGYNPELSDRPFREKRDMKGGFKDSPIRLNRTLAQLEHWNESEILQRAKELSEIALKIWNYPVLPPEIIAKYKKAKEPRVEKKYTYKDHGYLKENTKELFDELRKRILNLGPAVREEILKPYIAFKADTNFVDVIPMKSGLKLTLNIKYDEITDPEGLCNDVSATGHRVNGEVEVIFNDKNQIDYVMFLIKQAYDKQSDEQIE